MMKVLRPVVFLWLLSPALLWSQTISLSLQEFRTAAQSGQSLSEALEPPLLARFQEAWDRLGLAWGRASLDYPLTLDLGVLRDNCSQSAVARDFTGLVSLDDKAALAVNFQSLRDPVTLSLSVPLVFRIKGKVEQRFGLDAFHRCRIYARDNFTLTANGSGQLHLNIVIQPGIELVGNALQFTPKIEVRAELPEFERRVSVDHTAADGYIVDAIENKIDRLLGPKSVAEMGRVLEQRLRDRLQEAWGGPSLRVALPELDAPVTADLERLLSKELAFPVGETYLKGHLPEIWYSAITGDPAQLRDVVLNSAACEAASGLLLPVNAQPLFHRVEGACIAFDAANIKQPETLFADAACSRQVAVRPYPLTTYCRDNLDKTRIGNGAVLQGGPQSWHLSPGNRLDIALVSAAESTQPWVTERVYRKVATPAGECSLEMRIYKSDPDAKGLQPVIAFHGGNWQFRRLGTTAMEAVMPQFTERGAVVFMPFYHLAGDSEGVAACRNARAGEITSDVAAALDWVQAHGAEFGAVQGPVAVTGQSAGAHLAAWLASHRPDQVSAALLLYPPTDMADYLQQWRNGELGKDPKGLDAVKAFMRVDNAAAIDPFDPVVLDNSLPQIVALDPSRIPPLFIIHGGADELVPVRQSLRLCNALSGNPDSGPASAFQPGAAGQAVQTFSCDSRGSSLHVVTDGDHMLDFCPTDIWCPAGKPQDHEAVRQTLRQGYEWLTKRQVVVAGNSSGRSANAAVGGGGGFSFLALIVIGLIRSRSRMPA